MRKVNLLFDRIILPIQFPLRESKFILRNKCLEITNINWHLIFIATDIEN